MQPVKPRKSKDISLLDQLRLFHGGVELGMEFIGFMGKYSLDGMKDKRILVAVNGDDFIGSAKNIEESISLIALAERRKLSDYDTSTIQTVYVAEDEVIETKIREEAMPRKYPNKEGMQQHGKRFYVVKKKPNGSSSGKMFCLYNWDTRNLVTVHGDKDFFYWFLINKYKSIEYKDV